MHYIYIYIQLDGLFVVCSVSGERRQASSLTILSYHSMNTVGRQSEVFKQIVLLTSSKLLERRNASSYAVEFNLQLNINAK
jgi:hypothetical protein